MNAYNVKLAVNRALTGAASAVLLALALAAPAQATGFAPCTPDRPAPRLIGSVPGAIFEGVIVDAKGRLYATDLATGRVYTWAYPGATPTILTTVPGGIGAGALAFEPDGSLLIGYGSDPRVLAGDTFRSGRIERMNLTTRAITQVASGLSAADGLAVAADGTIYATNDFGNLIAKISPNGSVDPTWAHLPSANGAVLSADGRYLYVSRTFYNPGVSRIPVADPSAPQSLIDLNGSDSLKALDGLTLDSEGRAIVPTDLTGEILRVSGVGKVCQLSRAPLVSSVITYGHGSEGFSAGRLFRAGFDGKIYEIPAAFDVRGT
jgi:sugar lactone lactonase YvrE